LTNDPGVDGKPAWSPDGKKIAFVSNRSGQFEIYTMNAEDGSEQSVIPGSKLVLGKQYDVTMGVLGGPAWSPDGEWLAFSDSLIYKHISGADYNLPGIAIVRSDGSNYRVVTPDDNITTYRDSEPSWSPDGKYIVYMSSKSGLGEIYRVQIETGEIERLTNNSDADGSPCWSPVQ
jgi:Tol biopolymer transport system component